MDFFWVVTAASELLWLIVWAFSPDTPVRSRSKVDWAGGLGIGAALTTLTLGISQGNAWGWTTNRTIGIFVVGGVLTVSWIARELTTPAPMVDLRVVARRGVWPALILTALGNALGIYAAAGFLWYAYNHDTPAKIVVGMFIFGLAYAVSNTAAVQSFMSGALKGEYGMLASTSYSVTTLGNAIVPALFVAVASSKLIRIADTDISVPIGSSYHTVLIYASGIAAAGVIVALLAKQNRYTETHADNTVDLGA